MPDTKITALTALTAADPANDVLPIVDVSDTTMAASGTTKKISINNVLGCSGTATLASATITGALTAQGNVNLPANVSLKAGPSAAVQAGLKFDASYNTYLDSDIGLVFRTGAATSFTTSYQIGATGISTWSVGGSTAMTLNSTGLGVGGSPTTRFEVFSGFIRNTATTGSAQIIAGNTGGVFTLAKDNSTGGNFTGTAYASVLYSDGAYPVCIFSNGSERMRIDSSGNVGVSTTPKAWSSGAKALQILSFLSAWQGANGSANLGFGVYEGGANTYNYSTTGDAPTFYSQLTGAHRWYTAPSGTAGNAITFSQVMTLDANGNLILKSSNTPATLANNGELTVNATSNTNLRFSYRGSDGTTRVANITLA